MGELIDFSLVYKYLINLVTVIILFRFIYYKNYGKNELFLTFFGFNTIIFFVSYLLNTVEISTGAGFGLFAVFSILRYRTEGICAKDMTYLFISIAIGLLTAVGSKSYIELELLCFTIITLVFLLESSWLFSRESSKTIFYDSIALIKPEQKEDFVAELKQRTGLNIHRLKIDSVDFLKDSCSITVYYYEK
ncbi:DUF4956 domain-containing protein [Flavobacterium sp. W22_SRS_FP1]|uniref:DUF4956 domain-containing protein n=1 Tax=Flavobacterium sp. W22_SRS_FP1 TaxID=3240276 RepID=UPI003F902DE1